MAFRGREWNLETEEGLNHHGTGRVVLYLYFGGLDPTLGGAYCGGFGASSDDMIVTFMLLWGNCPFSSATR